jgi:coenzyme F420-0:L-glutamate ligase/coenzyme F420-1:gamma-L-glutamate ligase
MGSRSGERAAGEVRVLPLPVIGEVRAGDSLTEMLLVSAQSSGLRFQDGDILVVKHKIVSKVGHALRP